MNESSKRKTDASVEKKKEKNKSKPRKPFREALFRVFLAGVGFVLPFKALLDNLNTKSKIDEVQSTEEVIAEEQDAVSNNLRQLETLQVSDGMDNLRQSAHSLSELEASLEVAKGDILTLNDFQLRNLINTLTQNPNTLVSIHLNNELSVEALAIKQELEELSSLINENYNRNTNGGRETNIDFIENRAEVDAQLVRLNLDLLVLEYNGILEEKISLFRERYDRYLNQFSEFSSLSESITKAHATIIATSEQLNLDSNSELAGTLSDLQAVVDSWSRFIPPQSNEDLTKLSAWLAQTSLDIVSYYGTTYQGSDYSLNQYLSTLDQVITDLESDNNFNINLNSALLIVWSLIIIVTAIRRMDLHLVQLSNLSKKEREQTRKRFVESFRMIKRLKRLHKKLENKSGKNSPDSSKRLTLTELLKTQEPEPNTARLVDKESEDFALTTEKKTKTDSI